MILTSGRGSTMSSATSIEEVRLKPDVAQPDRDADPGFRPWHFFVLASLAAATAAVVMSRRSTPEHLILVSLTIGAAGAAAAGLYRMLAPLAIRDVSRLRDRPSYRLRAALEREKSLVLRSIKELEFDRAMGKVSPKDFDEMAGRLRARAMSLMRQLDTGAGYRELIERELQARLTSPLARPKRQARPGSKDPIPTSKTSVQTDEPPAHGGAGSLDPGQCACGTANDADAAFCKRCGMKLSAGAGQ
jgi:hypothetical protein